MPTPHPHPHVQKPSSAVGGTSRSSVTGVCPNPMISGSKPGTSLLSGLNSFPEQHNCKSNNCTTFSCHSPLLVAPSAQPSSDIGREDKQHQEASTDTDLQVALPLRLHLTGSRSGAPDLRLQLLSLNAGAACVKPARHQPVLQHAGLTRLTGTPLTPRCKIYYDIHAIMHSHLLRYCHYQLLRHCPRQCWRCQMSHVLSQKPAGPHNRF